ncbi:MAG: 23S rRNA (adenine(2503)-C(2))-methyltransferase RlmN [Kiritimatiellae bacterium]|nr:23S rRNA (adenine(2503)-C(2))-methyltransferase RlmN [Kiritimatiellia bacterium]
MKPSAYSLSDAELAAFFRDAGQPAFRARQVSEALWSGRAESWGVVQTLPASLREKLAERFGALGDTAAVVGETGDKSSGTRKLLLKLSDGALVETVLIPARDRWTVCVSSQVGCACGCAFCASGLSGCERNLASGEIAAQAVRAALEIGRRPDNVVFMGSGEPFFNYDNVLAAARRMNAPPPFGLGIGARRITVSTCGVVPGIKRFSAEGLQLELSVSLHAPTDALRSRLMPVNDKWHVAELIEACRAHTAETGRIVTFEYTRVEGVNDSPAQSAALLALLRGFPCRVNLIALNPVPEFPGRAPSPGVCETFRRALERGGVNATMRLSKGRADEAACGQLRRRYLEGAGKGGV